MNAKQELFDRLQYLDSAINLPIIIDQGVAQSSHNGVANLFRKGLGILAFNILEDYIKNRATEALKFISDSSISFNKLPDKLQEAAIAGTLNALGFQSKILKKNGHDWKTLIQEESLKIHSTKLPTFELSKFAFFSASSNINEKDVTELLQAFGISGGWTALKNISDSIGGGLPDLAQSYKNAASRRHSSAHTVSYIYPYGLLAGFKNEILAICASLDLLLSARCRQITGNLMINIQDHDLSVELNYRFLEKHGSSYRETNVIGGRAKKIWPNLSLAISTLSPKLCKQREFLLIFDDSKRISDWRT